MGTPKSRLQSAGFNDNETLVTLYSYLAGENLAWLFENAGVTISEARIGNGMDIIRVQTIDDVVSDDGATYHVVTSTNSTTVTGFNFNKTEKRIRFEVTGLEGTTVFCNVTIPRMLMWVDASDEWNVTVNGMPLNVQEKIVGYNGTHYSVYFTCHTSTIAIQIISKYVIPEFPSFLTLSLFLMVTLLALMLCKRRHVKI
jgi:hypothetical protein